MSYKTECRVLIVDDHPLMRRGIHQLLDLDKTFDVVGEASNGAEAISPANRLSPNMILLDLNMKGLTGLDTLNALRRDGINSLIIILTVSDSRSDIFTLIDAGADGYLLKDNDPEVMLKEIRHSLTGEKAFSAKVLEYLHNRNNGEYAIDPLTELTKRELDVLSEVAKGLSNKQVAINLHISEETVKVHIRNILRKLKVPSRVAATVLYLENRT